MNRSLALSLVALLSCACGGAPPPEAPAPAAPPAAAGAPAAAAGMPPAVGEAMGRVLVLLADPSDKGIQAAFSPQFLAAVPPTQVKTIFEGVKTQLGACKEQHPVSVASDTKSVVRVQCEKGAIDATIVVNPAPGHLIDGLLLKPAS